MSESRKNGNIMLVAAFGIGALLTIAPFIWVFSSSFRPFAEATSLPPKWLPPLHLDFKNYRALFAETVPFVHFFGNSFKVASLVTAGILVNSALAGYAFARLKFPGRNALFYAMLSSLMIPVQVIIVPLFLIMRSFDLVNTHGAIILPGLLGAFAPGIPGIFGIFMLRQFFMTLPKELEEAAKIDGAGYWKTFRAVIVPTAKPTLSALGIIVFSMCWNDYFFPFIFINSIEKMLLPVGILAIRQPFGTGDPIELAAVTLSILPVLAVFIAGQKWIVESFVQTGIKG
ncbi:carbohydrate ABC transporter permease [Paenibacillaceae bacterium WGS1546]|uniref:carbohydrate ABC transporter permease n=1 Tax=Cohnella sp. WGS1546 TaxID=3366810 RepID=UPI00372CFAD3